jgi:signal transduction histidine kinase
MINKQTDSHKGDILIVDDDLASFRSLSSMLTAEGYEVRGVPDGPMALTVVENKPPELILLDIKMPGMDGFEVCQQIKADEKSSDIPILFLSALDKLEDKLKGFSIGAADFITKPFQAQEVLARVDIHIKFSRLRQNLEEQVVERTAELESEINERKQIEISLQASREKAEALAANLISTQEAGSAQLARELHDDIIQRLAFLKIEVDKLEMKNPSLPEPAGDKLRQIARDIGVLSSDIHMISRRLHPITLEILGLVRSIETECQNFTRLNEIPVTLDLDSTVQYPSKEISLCTYRILQEGLRNIVRHARATGVHVTLFKKNDILHLLIKDDGIGFDPASDGVNAGLGIASMTERARLLQGSLSIESRPGKGTAIKLAVPLKSR